MCPTVFFPFESCRPGLYSLRTPVVVYYHVALIFSKKRIYPHCCLFYLIDVCPTGLGWFVAGHYSPLGRSKISVRFDSRNHLMPPCGLVRRIRISSTSLASLQFARVIIRYVSTSFGSFGSVYVVVIWVYTHSHIYCRWECLRLGEFPSPCFLLMFRFLDNLLVVLVLLGTGLFFFSEGYHLLWGWSLSGTLDALAPVFGRRRSWTRGLLFLILSRRWLSLMEIHVSRIRFVIQIIRVVRRFV